MDRFVTKASASSSSAARPAFEIPTQHNQTSAVRPVVFLSSNLFWSSQQSESGIELLREGVLDAIEYGAEVICVAGLGWSNIATLREQHQMESLDNEVRDFLKTELLPHVRKRWKETVAQPDCQMLFNATCATFYLRSFADEVDYRTIDPGVGRPALGVIFHRQGSKLCVFTACWNRTPRRSKMRMLQEYVKCAQERCSAEQPHFLIGGSFDLGKALMDRFLCDLAVPVDILINDALGTDYMSARDFALVGGGLQCSSGGRPCTDELIDVRVLIQDPAEPSHAHAPEPAPKKVRLQENHSDPLQVHGPEPPPKTFHAHSEGGKNPQNNSAAQPLKLKPRTPLYDQFIANLDAEGEANLLDELAETFMFGDVAHINVHGDRVDRRMPLAMKAEDLLEVTEAQRHRHYERLRARRDPRTMLYNLESFWFSNDDMKEIFNEWKKDYKSWLHAASISQYESLLRTYPQGAHKLLHSRYHTYLFQLFGSKVLTHKFIELPLCSAERPAAIIRELVDEWWKFKKTPRCNLAAN